MRQIARTFLLWSLFFAILWLLLTGASGLVFGGVSALAAAAIATWVGLPLLRLRLVHLPGFAGFFLAQLWLGGWDVARRALAPTLVARDGWVQYSCTYPSPRVQLLLSASVGLLPGTLSTGVNNGVLEIHALDQHSNWQPVVARLEQHLAKLLGEAHSVETSAGKSNGSTNGESS